VGLQNKFRKNYAAKINPFNITEDLIVETTYKVYCSSLSEFKWPRTAKETFNNTTRKREIVEFRQAVMFLLYKVLKYGPMVSQRVMKKNYKLFDHSTYHYGRENYEDLINTNEIVRNRCLAILEKLHLDEYKIL
jgi:hypothetical protein